MNLRKRSVFNQGFYISLATLTDRNGAKKLQACSKPGKVSENHSTKATVKPAAASFYHIFLKIHLKSAKTNLHVCQ